MKEINSNFEKFFPKENVIVMLHAHADDESFLSAGTINEFIVRGYNILLIYLAAGLVENEQETLLRQKELSMALETLGAHNVKFLKYCEPKYKGSGAPLYLQSIREVSNEIIKFLNKERIKKYILFSYDKNGGYGNKDHLVVHKVGRYLFKKSSVISSLFEVTISRDMYTDWFSKESGRVSETYLPKLSYWSTEFGLTDEEINYIYVLNSKQIWLKKKALIKHVSQIKNTEFPLSLTNTDFIKLFGREYLAYVNRSILQDIVNFTEATTGQIQSKCPTRACRALARRGQTFRSKCVRAESYNSTNMNEKDFNLSIFDGKGWSKISKSLFEIEKECFLDLSFSWKDFCNYFSNPKIIAVILRYKNDIIGFSFGFPSGDDSFFIYDTAIKKEFQGRGLVSLIMNFLEKKLKEDGYKYIEREADVDNGYADKIRRHYKGRIIEEGIPHNSIYSKGKQVFFKIKI
jgi:LmbE family N-acetylglucosaminyl deacetylase